MYSLQKAMAKGDQIFVPRNHLMVPYEHHGIDCGNGSVIHYDGEAIRRITLSAFRQGESINYKHYRAEQCFHPDVTVRLAESCLGEALYDLWINNCEHFATWCKTGKWESEQVSLISMFGSFLPNNHEALVWQLRQKLSQEMQTHNDTRAALNEVQAQRLQEAEEAALITTLADYRPLKQALEQQRWQEADGLTRSLMLKVGAARNSRFFEAKEIDRFPPADLKIIDRLWRHYSQSHFGFSVQKEIYERLGNTSDFSNSTYDQFHVAVGWNGPSQFSPQAARGHLPFGGRNRWEIVGFFALL